MLKEHLEKLNCRAPYQTSQKELPICQTKRKMKEADYFFKPKTKACTSLEGVIYRYEETNLVYKTNTLQMDFSLKISEQILQIRLKYWKLSRILFSYVMNSKNICFYMN